MMIFFLKIKIDSHQQAQKCSEYKNKYSHWGAQYVAMMVCPVYGWVTKSLNQMS